MNNAVKCEFDITIYYVENETACYVTPVDKPDKIMVQFDNSFDALRFMFLKGFDYKDCEFHKNGRRYVMWVC